jgi:hypothetical protein
VAVISSSDLSLKKELENAMLHRQARTSTPQCTSFERAHGGVSENATKNGWLLLLFDRKIDDNDFDLIKFFNKI